MCSIEAHYREQLTVNDDSISGGDIILKFNSTKSELLSLGTTLNFIEIWIKPLKENICIKQQCIMKKCMSF